MAEWLPPLRVREREMEGLAELVEANVLPILYELGTGGVEGVGAACRAVGVENETGAWDEFLFLAEEPAAAAVPDGGGSGDEGGWRCAVQ